MSTAVTPAPPRPFPALQLVALQVCDCGHGATSAVPVVDGYVLNRAVQRGIRGGDWLTQQAYSYLAVSAYSALGVFARCFWCFCCWYIYIYIFHHSEKIVIDKLTACYRDLVEAFFIDRFDLIRFSSGFFMVSFILSGDWENALPRLCAPWGVLTKRCDARVAGALINASPKIWHAPRTAANYTLFCTTCQIRR